MDKRKESLSERILAKARQDASSVSKTGQSRRTARQYSSRPELNDRIRRRISAHRRRKTNILLGIFLPLGIIVLGLLLFLMFRPMETASGGKTTAYHVMMRAITSDPLPTYFDHQRDIYALFVGLDHDPPHRSDTVMLAHIDLNTLQSRVLSVPRDLRVQMPSGGWDKLAHAYVYGRQRDNDGVAWVKQSVEGLLGIEATYYFVIKFDGFVKLVDSVGGVNIDVKKALKYRDRAQDLVIDIPAGEQHMDGEQLLKYVRFRHDALGDIGRMQRQQNAIHALIAALKRGRSYTRIPAIIGAMSDTFETNLRLDQIAALARAVPDIQDDYIQSMTLFSDSTTIDGISYQVTDSKSVAEALAFLEDLSPPVETETADEESKDTEAAGNP